MPSPGWKRILLEGDAAVEDIIFGACIHMLSPADLTIVSGDSGYSTMGEAMIGRIATPATVNTGVSKGTRYRSGYNEPGLGVFGKNPQFEALVMLLSVTAMDAYILFGTTSTYAPYSATKQFGIHVLNGALYTVSRDGATLTELDQATTLAVQIWYRIRVKLISGTAVRTWVDGVQKTDKTTNLPAGVEDGGTGLFYILRTTEAVAKFLYFHETRFMHNY